MIDGVTANEMAKWALKVSDTVDTKLPCIRRARKVLDFETA